MTSCHRTASHLSKAQPPEMTALNCWNTSPDAPAPSSTSHPHPVFKH